MTVAATVKASIRYGRYVIRHKFYVFLECCRLGIPLAGVVHDWSKLLPDEFFPYALSFYGPKRDEAVKNAFNLAWLKHLHRSAHHWQHWILTNDAEPPTVIEMPDRYRREMLADWRGAGRAQENQDTLQWYCTNRDKIVLGPRTRTWIEQQLHVLVPLEVG